MKADIILPGDRYLAATYSLTWGCQVPVPLAGSTAAWSH